MSTLAVIGGVAGVASILLNLWMHRGPSVSVLVSRRVMPNGDVIEVRR